MILPVANQGGIEVTSLIVKTMFQRKQYDIAAKAIKQPWNVYFLGWPRCCDSSTGFWQHCASPL
jgi:hypothetical protein